MIYKRNEKGVFQNMNLSLTKTDLNQYTEFYTLVQDLISNKTVQKMKEFRQHYDTSTYEHCFYVAYMSYKICKKLGLDYKAAARAGILHDLFLYDWRNSSKLLNLERKHAFIHPKIALENASKLFTLTDKEKDIIVKHMWPVTLALPKYPESFIVTFVDKYSALQESFVFYHSFLKRKKLYKYAYIFLCLLIMI